MGKSESRLKLSSLIASNFCLLGSYIYTYTWEEFIEMSGLLGIFLFLVKNNKISLAVYANKINMKSVTYNKIKKIVTAKWIVPTLPTTALLHLYSIYSN